jgi:coenzyme F420 hydrogenase subunit beta
MRIEKLSEIVDWRLCVGCGVCAYVCPHHTVVLWDFATEGIRPVVDESKCGECRQCLEVCPAVQCDFREDVAEVPCVPPHSASTDSFNREWGPILEILEGHAVDPEIRFMGSSGGVLTAIGAFCIETAGMHGVLQIAQDPGDPIRNRTRLSRSRQELLAATGSRYAPASVCDRLHLVEGAPGPCAIIGKPAEIAALRKAQKLNPALTSKVGVALSFFCAETPSTAGTVALLAKMGITPDALTDLRYRGRGWPGYFAPLRRGETAPREKMTYRESWSFLQAYRPWSAHLWPDGTGEMADISCGDPWYREPDGTNPGSSIVVVRTARGREIVKSAMEAGFLALQAVEPWKLARSQPNLLDKKRAIWGRLLAMRLLGLPVPRFLGAHLFRCWLDLPAKEKLRSVLGTARRVLARRFRKPLELNFAAAVRLTQDGRNGTER